MSLLKMTKMVRIAVLMGIAVVVGLFVSIKRDDAARHSILLDFDTQETYADAYGQGYYAPPDSGSSDSGSSDSGSGDCGSGDSGY